MRGVIEIRKEGQGKSDWTCWGISNPNWKVSNGYLFLSGRPQGYFHCSHQLSLLCLSLNRLTSLVTLATICSSRNFGLHGLMATSPITPSRTNSTWTVRFSTVVSSHRASFTLLQFRTCGRGESDWSVSDQELTFVPPFSDQAEGRLTRFLVFQANPHTPSAGLWVGKENNFKECVIWEGTPKWATLIMYPDTRHSLKSLNGCLCV